MASRDDGEDDDDDEPASKQPARGAKFGASSSVQPSKHAKIPSITDLIEPSLFIGPPATRVSNKVLSSALRGVTARTLQRYVKIGMPTHCAEAAHTWWMDIKAKQAQQPRKKKYIGKPGDMRMADLARQLNLSPSYTGQLVKKGM
jgi:hypothetical protein